jgi:uncharacterized protein YabN with tetrapyrrole methylase and pyrophosphatase domain
LAAAPDRGSLTIVGSGIRPGLHTTPEARRRIERADSVLYLLAEVAPTRWLEQLNPSAESLAPLYRAGRRHADVYADILTTILDRVRQGLDVCIVFYGHPGVFDQTTHEAVRRAREEGYPARILPGVSAEDCLYADVGLDPGANGCQTFDATDFLVRHRRPDVGVPLVLWQVSVVGGNRTTATVDRDGLRVLSERLADLYGADHGVVVYEATPFPVGRPTIERLEIRELPSAKVTGLASLYVPPKAIPERDPEVMRQLGMDA